MNVVLFNPAPRSGWQPHRRVELPLGLLSVATPLDRRGVSVKLIDGYADPQWKAKLQQALEEKPICFGVTSMTGPQILHALEGCRLVRDRHPDVPIVWGGVHASLLPEQTLQHPLVDIVVIGEGEATFPELVRALVERTPLAEVAGLAYKEEDKLCRNGLRPFVDLNAQPAPAYHLLDMDRYRRRLFGVDHVSLNSSRGCVHRCKFCWDPVMHRRKWRAMGAETVLAQIRRVVEEYGLRGFLFTDDNFFIDMDRAHQILEGIVRSGLDITLGKLQVRAESIVKMDPGFLDLLVRANVKRVTIGVESGSQRMLDLIGKDLTPETVIEANRKLGSTPIRPLFLFMMGLPTETPADFEQSVRLATRLTGENPKASKTFNIYTPYPGTELFETCRGMGFKEPDTLEAWARWNFRNVQEGAGWIGADMKALIRGLDFPLMFLEQGRYVTYRKTNPMVRVLARLYSPLARYRVAHMEARFPVESRMVKALGLFARQE